MYSSTLECPSMYSNTLECLLWRKPTDKSNLPNCVFFTTGRGQHEVQICFYFMVVFTSCSQVTCYTSCWLHPEVDKTIRPGICGITAVSTACIDGLYM